MTNRKFGIEVEFHGRTDTALARLTAAGIPIFNAGYTHRITSEWKLVSDSSVSANSRMGGELVSPILSGLEGIETARKAINALAKVRSAHVSRKCGLHVHMEVADFNLRQMKNLVKMFAKYEDVLDAFVSSSRRGNGATYCKSTFDGFGSVTCGATHTAACATLFARVDACQSISEVIALKSSRYQKLNLQSYLKYGTVEIRMHQGTIDSEKVAYWVELVNYLVECARNASHVANRKPEHGYGRTRQKNFWCGCERKELRSFFAARSKALAAPEIENPRA